ncbi:MAG: IS1634 family transposase [Bacteroidota bacterium]|nr:IS1634 family transposase [Bacteroidota bacterium]
MFIKSVSNKKGSATYITYRLVRSQRVHGVPRHINIMELGSLPNIPKEKHAELAHRIEKFINGDILLFDQSDNKIEQWAYHFYKILLKKKLDKAGPEEKDSKRDFQTVDFNSFEALDSKEIGGEWLCKQAIEQLGLKNFLSGKLGWGHNQVSVSMLALLGRLLYPGSESRTARCLNENSAALELYSPDSKSIDRNRLQQASVNLYKSKAEIETYLSNKISDIYEIDSKFILYDLTNTHFEGQAKNYEKAKFGRNKQKRNDCRQVTLGLLTDEHGFCKQSRYYAGNVSEPETFAQVVADAKLHCKHKRPIIIMDAGIATEDNIKYCLSEGCDYICVSRSAHKEIRAKLDKEELKGFKNKSGDEVRAQLFTGQIEHEKEGEIYTVDEKILYVETDAKKGKEQGMFEQKRQRFEKGLEDIKSSLTKPRGNKTLEKIHQRIGRLKEKYPGMAAAYKIKVSHKKEMVFQITYTYDENNAKLEKTGSYFIRTSIAAENEELFWKLYRTLGEIENTFRILKSDLDMRPIFHQKGENIEAHLNLAVLAYFIVSFIRHKLKYADIHHCWDEISRIMKTQKCNTDTIIDKNEKKILIKRCTRPAMNVTQIYKAMGYKTMPYYRKKTYLDY